jgi:hypothetical protein
MHLNCSKDASEQEPRVRRKRSRSRQRRDENVENRSLCELDSPARLDARDLYAPGLWLSNNGKHSSVEYNSDLASELRLNLGQDGDADRYRQKQTYHDDSDGRYYEKQRSRHRSSVDLFAACASSSRGSDNYRRVPSTSAAQSASENESGHYVKNNNVNSPSQKDDRLMARREKLKKYVSLKRCSSKVSIASSLHTVATPETSRLELEKTARTHRDTELGEEEDEKTFPEPLKICKLIARFPISCFRKSHLHWLSSNSSSHFALVFICNECYYFFKRAYLNVTNKKVRRTFHC